MARSAFLYALAGVVMLGAASAEVLLVYSVQRHGARNVLPKTATLKESDAAGGPTLLPQGQRQAYDAGAAFVERYLNASTCAQADTCLGAALSANSGGAEYGVVGTPGGEFNNFNSLVRSSALDRTIMTARSFLDAVFPPVNNATATAYLPDGQQVVPVYSLPDDGDALIRAYAGGCPAYDARLLDWYESDEFKAKEAETEALRNSVAAQAAGLNTSLTNWWNVYDGFNVYRTYGVGTPMPPIDNATFAEMQALAYWLETSKMASNLTGPLLASALLGDLLSYVDAAEAATSANLVSPVYYKLVHLSGHYNTQLGVLGALGVDQDPAAADLPWLKKIPSLAALMVFELHGDTSSDQQPQELAVRLVIQDGPANNFTVVPLPCAEPGDSAESLAGPGACTLDSFRALVGPLATNSTGAWCDMCENDSWTACKLQAATRALNATEGATTADATSTAAAGDGSGLSSGAVAGIAIGCAIAGAVLVAAAFVLHNRRAQRKRDAAQLAAAQQPGAFLAGGV